MQACTKVLSLIPKLPRRWKTFQHNPTGVIMLSPRHKSDLSEKQF